MDKASIEEIREGKKKEKKEKWVKRDIYLEIVVDNNYQNCWKVH
jgi:hypothetical protein